ncbi:MAG: UxaA family hydrolase [Oscillibacter sp.]|nr:UxaA family hydrolase [Oscillibacter sp.]
MLQLTGYPRPNGQAGIRNYALVISTVHCANTAAQKIAFQTGAHVITHDVGCVEFEQSHARTCLALLTAAKNPNIGAVLLVGAGCEQTDLPALEREIAETGKPVGHVTIQEAGGAPEAVALGVERLERLKAAAVQERVPIPFSKLVVGVQCGGSDWTTALAGNTTLGAMTDRIIAAGGTVLMGEVAGLPGSEHIIAEHAVSKEAGLQIIDMCSELRAEFLETRGQAIEEVNPTPGNKAGGITTLVEKSMGNIKKMGSAPVQGTIRAGEAVPHPGLWIVDIRSDGPDANTTSGFAMAGANLTVFSTGRGSPMGNVAMPVLKVTGNPEAFQALGSILDFNAGDTLMGTDVEIVAERLMALVAEVVNGKETKSEINGDFEFIIPRERQR